MRQGELDIRRRNVKSRVLPGSGDVRHAAGWKKGGRIPYRPPSMRSRSLADGERRSIAWLGHFDDFSFCSKRRRGPVYHPSLRCRENVHATMVHPMASFVRASEEIISQKKEISQNKEGEERERGGSQHSIGFPRQTWHRSRKASLSRPNAIYRELDNSSRARKKRCDRRGNNNQTGIRTIMLDSASKLRRGEKFSPSSASSTGKMALRKEKDERAYKPFTEIVSSS